MNPRVRRAPHRRGQEQPGNPAVSQAIHHPRALPTPHPVDETASQPLTNIEASEGWGFESLRARNIKRRLACVNVGWAPFKIRPLWTPGAPGVLVCFGIVCAGVGSGVL